MRVEEYDYGDSTVGVRVWWEAERAIKKEKYDRHNHTPNHHPLHL